MTTLLLIAGAIALLLLVSSVYSHHTACKIEAVSPPCGIFVDVDGVRLHVRDEGSGPALLMLHGLAGQMAHFSYGAVAGLSQRFRVITVDRPGSGYSTRPEGVPADLSTQARAIAGLIEKLELRQPTIVGHSLGGALALTLALEYPKLVGSLALVAPLTHAPERVQPVFRALDIRSGWLRRLFASTLSVPLGIAGTRLVLREVFKPEAAPPDFPTRGGGLLSLRPRNFLASSADLQAMPAHMAVLAPRYPQLAVPVHVLFGRQDALLDWRANGQALADALPGTRLQLVDGGHMLPITQPELTARFVMAAALTRLVAAG